MEKTPTLKAARTEARPQGQTAKRTFVAPALTRFERLPEVTFDDSMSGVPAPPPGP